MDIHPKVSLQEQEAVCERHGVDRDPPLDHERVGIALQTLHLLPLNALRIPRVGSVCGWYIWGGGDPAEDPEFFQPLCVEHLGKFAAGLLPYLAMPAGWRVLLAPGYEDVWFDGALSDARA
jgi:hypothetical protein